MTAKHFHLNPRDSRFTATKVSWWQLAAQPRRPSRGTFRKLYLHSRLANRLFSQTPVSMRTQLRSQTLGTPSLQQGPHSHPARPLTGYKLVFYQVRVLGLHPRIQSFTCKLTEFLGRPPTEDTDKRSWMRTPYSKMQRNL